MTTAKFDQLICLWYDWITDWSLLWLFDWFMIAVTRRLYSYFYDWSTDWSLLLLGLISNDMISLLIDHNYTAMICRLFCQCSVYWNDWSLLIYLLIEHCDVHIWPLHSCDWPFDWQMQCLVNDWPMQWLVDLLATAMIGHCNNWSTNCLPLIMIGGLIDHHC